MKKVRKSNPTHAQSGASQPDQSPAAAPAPAAAGNELWAEPLPRLYLANCFCALLAPEGALADAGSLAQTAVPELREQWHAALVAARRAGPSQDEATALISLAALACITGDPAETGLLSEQALFVTRTLPGSSLTGHALCNLGNARLAQGDPAAAKQHYLAALQSARAHDDRLSEVFVLLNLGQAYEATDQWHEARLRYHTAEGVARRAQLRDVQHAIQIRLGRVAEALGDLPAATCHYAVAATEAQRVGDWEVEVVARNALGVIYEDRREYGLAIVALEELVRRAGAVGDRQARWIGRLAQARLFSTLAETWPIARQHCQEALRLARQTADQAAEGLALGWLAHVLYLQGDVAEAQHHYLDRLLLAQLEGDWEADGRTNYNLAVLAASCQNWELALAHVSDALKIFDYCDAPAASIRRVQALSCKLHRQAPPDKVNGSALA